MSRSAPARKSKSTRCSTARGGGHIDVPVEMALGALPVTLDDMLAHARTQAPLLSREQKMVERGELAANLAPQGLHPRLHPLGRLLQPGRHAAHVADPRRRQTPRLLQQTECRGRRAGLRATEARHNYEAADVAIEARIREYLHRWPRRRASWSTSTRNR